MAKVSFPTFWGVIRSIKVVSIFRFGDRKCRFRDIAIRAFLRKTVLTGNKSRHRARTWDSGGDSKGLDDDDDDDNQAIRRFQLPSYSSGGLAPLKSWWQMNGFDPSPFKNWLRNPLVCNDDRQLNDNFI